MTCTHTFHRLGGIDDCPQCAAALAFLKEHCHKIFNDEKQMIKMCLEGKSTTFAAFIEGAEWAKLNAESVLTEVASI